MKRNIVLADDDLDDCMLFEDAINEISHDIKLIVANNGNALMSTLEGTVPPPPFAIFLDLNMPGKNGFECLKEIRLNPKFESIPVVIFSTSKNENAIDETYSLGANYYMIKPSSFSMLKEVIRKLLSIDAEVLRIRPSRDQYYVSLN